MIIITTIFGGLYKITPKTYVNILDFILVLLFFGTLLLSSLIDKNVMEGAQLKQLFDFYVFGWIDDIEPLNVKDKSLINKNKKEFRYQIENDGKKPNEGVRDWYTNISSEDKFTNIKNAMKENINFDYNINKRSIRKHFIILLISIFVVSCLSNFSFDILLSRIFIMYAPIAQHYIEMVVNYFNIQKMNDEIEKDLESSKIISDLLKIQNKMLEKRMLVTFNNNREYSLDKDNLR